MINIENIIYGKDITSNLWEFKLKTPVHTKSGKHIILDLQDKKYDTFIFYRNRKGDLVHLIIKKEL